ncbi:hypothetical protein PR202_ga27997 [Eleusine coracana subsp. coracana]|uniref:Uncharacterized protein n=1 Tax=Eleusine coracana subsp. coracana TaxID=191504 RepID=A0AAV5DI94_ELECO|nr:hypothetical protein PR202_ga27997 [Eleusine coracana subsp. coracana]
MKKGKPDLRPNRKQFKKHRNEAAAEQQRASAALLLAAVDDADFPRGGRSLLSRDKVADARAEADFDNEGKKGKGKRKRKGGESSVFDADDDLGTRFGGATTGKLPPYSITWNSCHKAGELKAKILKIDEERHIVSLRMKKFYFDSDMIDGINDGDGHNIAPMDMRHTPQIVGFHNSGVLHKSESRPSVLPLQVSLDDSEGSDLCF